MTPEPEIRPIEFKRSLPVIKDLPEWSRGIRLHYEPLGFGERVSLLLRGETLSSVFEAEFRFTRTAYLIIRIALILIRMFSHIKQETEK